MSKLKEELQEELEAYRIINSRINSEVDEFYSINELFLLIQVLGIFGMLIALNDFGSRRDWWLIFVPLAVLLITAWYWLKLNASALNWREDWVRQAKELECKKILGELTPWKNTEAPHLKDSRGVWKTVGTLPYVFIATWVFFGAYLLLTKCRITF